MIIAICGAKNSGKDTCADYITIKYPGAAFRHLKIAGPLKEMCGLLFGWSPEKMENPLTKETVDKRWGVSPRTAMQFMGTEMMQYKIQEMIPDVGRTFWIRSLVNRIQPGENVVISDMRFQHEYDGLVAAFGKAAVNVIKITRPAAASASTSDDDHCSEHEWNHIPHDVMIRNNGSIDDFYKQVDKVVAVANPS